VLLNQQRLGPEACRHRVHGLAEHPLGVLHPRRPAGGAQAAPNSDKAISHGRGLDAGGFPAWWSGEACRHDHVITNPPRSPARRWPSLRPPAPALCRRHGAEAQGGRLLCIRYRPDLSGREYRPAAVTVVCVDPAGRHWCCICVGAFSGRAMFCFVATSPETRRLFSLAAFSFPGRIPRVRSLFSVDRRPSSSLTWLTSLYRDAFPVFSRALSAQVTSRRRWALSTCSSVLRRPSVIPRLLVAPI